MSLLDDEDVLIENSEKELRIKEEFERNISISLLNNISATVVKGNSSIVPKLKSIIDAGVFSLKEYKSRDIISIDCRHLCKGDAFGWLKSIADNLNKGTINKPILVIENADKIPVGDSKIYDVPQYVENILVRSWKEESVVSGDLFLDWKKLGCSVIITYCDDNSTQFLRTSGLCSYAYLGDLDFEQWLIEERKFAEDIVYKSFNLK